MPGHLSFLAVTSTSASSVISVVIHSINNRVTCVISCVKSCTCSVKWSSVSSTCEWISITLSHESTFITWIITWVINDIINMATFDWANNWLFNILEYHGSSSFHCYILHIRSNCYNHILSYKTSFPPPLIYYMFD